MTTLGEVIRKLIDHAHEGLKKLKNEARLLSYEARKKAIIQYCEDCRHQALQLLALIQWFRQDYAQITRYDIEFLKPINGDQARLKEMVDVLNNCLNILYASKAPIFAVNSAIDLLMNSAKNSLPKLVDDEILMIENNNNEKIKDQEEDNTIKTNKRKSLLHKRLLSTLHFENKRLKIVSEYMLLFERDKLYKISFCLDEFSHWRVVDLQIFIREFDTNGNTVFQKSQLREIAFGIENKLENLFDLTDELVYKELSNIIGSISLKIIRQQALDSNDSNIKIKEEKDDDSIFVFSFEDLSNKKHHQVKLKTTMNENENTLIKLFLLNKEEEEEEEIKTMEDVGLNPNCLNFSKLVLFFTRFAVTKKLLLLKESLHATIKQYVKGTTDEVLNQTCELMIPKDNVSPYILLLLNPFSLEKQYLRITIREDEEAKEASYVFALSSNAYSKTWGIHSIEKEFFRAENALKQNENNEQFQTFIIFSTYMTAMAFELFAYLENEHQIQFSVLPPKELLNFIVPKPLIEEPSFWFQPVMYYKLDNNKGWFLVVKFKSIFQVQAYFVKDMEVKQSFDAKELRLKLQELKKKS